MYYNVLEYPLDALEGLSVQFVAVLPLAIPVVQHNSVVIRSAGIVLVVVLALSTCTIYYILCKTPNNHSFTFEKS